MSNTVKKFHNIFWQNKACRNLFLLNRDELLEHHEITLETLKRVVYSNVIVITNESERDSNFQLLETRVQNRNLDHEFSLEQKLSIYKPKFEKFFEEHYQKSFEKLEKDLKNPLRLIPLFRKVCRLFDEKKFESALLDLLQEYYFVGQNVKNLEQLEIHFFGMIKKHFGMIVNEETTFHFYDSIESIKNLYTNIIYTRLLKSKRIIAKYLDSKDNFQERLNMLDLLYEAKIIENVNQEAFFECTNCDQNIFKGTMYLKIRPNKLAKFKCPNCEKGVFYLAPYKLNEEIYKLITQNDGIIIHLLAEILNERKIKSETNIPVSELINGNYANSEIDLAVKQDGVYKYVFETKMLHANNEPRKHIKKIHSALNETYNLKEILEAKGEANKITRYYLILNLDDEEIINEAKQTFTKVGTNGEINVMSLEAFKASNLS